MSTSTVEAPTAEPTITTAEQGLTDIYIGKGRYVKDDPKKYPGKDDLGPLIGASGMLSRAVLAPAWQASQLFVSCKSQPCRYVELGV